MLREAKENFSPKLINQILKQSNQKPKLLDPIAEQDLPHVHPICRAPPKP